MAVIKSTKGQVVVNGDPVAYYHSYTFNSHRDFDGAGEMHGARRVIIFCLLMAVLPTILLIIPLYLRHSLFADVTYSVAESDVLEIGDGISTVFCQDHTLKMNSSFNAYQLDGKPEMGSIRKHIRLKKSMSLPDDTLEYWGFFLPKGSTVKLSVCSRFEGSRILVVKGEKNLRTCGLLDHTKTEGPVANMAKDQGQVRVTFETHAQEIHSDAPDGGFENEIVDNETSTRNERSVSQDSEENDAREVEETDGLKAFMILKEIAKKYVSKNEESKSLRTFEESVIGHKLRHSRGRAARTNKLSNEMIDDRIDGLRKRRNTMFRTPVSLDAKVAHGGNAHKPNYTNSEDESMSSFESALLTCYDGDILLTQSFPPSHLCTNTSFLLTSGARRMTTTHNVVSDGYYYYIFYSDNDFVLNDIHAIFDIFKPTYQYSNVSKQCVNKTECTFPVGFLSDEIVLVEVPTRDGIEHEDDDITLLLSICQPRMSVYIVFPILVLFLILGCAFL